jgi:hypothetical protein
MIDGIYTMTYRGAISWGIGVLVLRRGTVTGADAAGGLYDGRYVEQADNVVLEMKMTVPAGMELVQGTPPQPKPYEVPFNATIPKRAIETSEPVLVPLPPGPCTAAAFYSISSNSSRIHGSHLQMEEPYTASRADGASESGEIIGKIVRPPNEAASFAHYLSSVATTLRVHTQESLNSRIQRCTDELF